MIQSWKSTLRSYRGQSWQERPGLICLCGLDKLLIRPGSDSLSRRLQAVSIPTDVEYLDQYIYCV